MSCKHEWLPNAPLFGKAIFVTNRSAITEYLIHLVIYMELVIAPYDPRRSVFVNVELIAFDTYQLKDYKRFDTSYIPSERDIRTVLTL